MNVLKISTMCLLASSLLTGCVMPVKEVPTVPILAPFDFNEAMRQLKPGENTIKGNAFLRQNGGGVVTCAGQTVFLVPATDYARKRFAVLYGNSDSGLLSGPQNYRIVPDVPEYQTANRTEKCDSQGNFVFDKVADGEFFISVTVTWQVGYSQQGGALMQRVSIKNHQTLTTIITQ